MGHKVTVVHGVKSDKFYEPGNAINQIWLGNLEILSRLPFGDSDLAQAAWPKGGWPKIPWHHFIIPLKRRALEMASSFEAGVHRGGTEQVILTDPPTINPPPPSQPLLLAVTTCLPAMVLCAFSFPVFLRRDLRRTMHSDTSKLRTTQWMKHLKVCAFLATLTMIVGLLLAFLDFYAWSLDARSHRLVTSTHAAVTTLFKSLSAIAMSVGFFYAAAAVNAIWAEWRRCYHLINDESINRSQLHSRAASVEEHLLMPSHAVSGGHLFA